MTDLRRSTRRQVLKGAAVVDATAALLSPTAALAQNTSATEGTVGSWIFTVTITSGPTIPPFKVLGTFDTGGGFVETEQGDQAPSGSPPILASPGHGAWVSTGSNYVAFKFVKLLYDTGCMNDSAGKFGIDNWTGRKRHQSMLYNKLFIALHIVAEKCGLASSSEWMELSMSHSNQGRDTSLAGTYGINLRRKETLDV